MLCPEDWQDGIVAELDDLIDELLVIAPAIGAILESRGDDVRPDPEIPTSWAGSVGGSVARLFPGLEPAVRVRALGSVQRGISVTW